MNYAVFPSWVSRLTPLLKQAGEAILDIRSNGFDAVAKADSSPVTRADFRSEEIILAGLQHISPEIPVISEERGVPDWNTRRQWQYLWLVDPLDGTREFVAGRDEFTINIALIDGGTPVLGMIFQPVTGRMTIAYRSAPQQGEWVCYASLRHSDTVDLVSRSKALPVAAPLRVVVSDHYGDRDLRYLPERLKCSYPDFAVVRVGSAIKFCLLAEGAADFYVRHAPCCEWDTAAGQAILQAVGGGVCDFFGRPLVYNRRESMVNGSFYAYPAQFAGRDWLSPATD